MNHHSIKQLDHLLFPSSFALPKIPNFISSIVELQADPPFSSDVEIQKNFDLGVNFVF